jgi:hypothetical protein
VSHGESLPGFGGVANTMWGCDMSGPGRYGHIYLSDSDSVAWLGDAADSGWVGKWHWAQKEGICQMRNEQCSESACPLTR